MQFLKPMLLASSILTTTIASAQAEVKVITSIKPLHSLVAAVMDGVSTPDLIVQGTSSPHTYSMKPSQAVNLENADLVFWIGHQLEAFLEKPLESIAQKATIIELIETHDLTKHEFRAGGAFDEHDHDDEEKHADEHDHSDEHKHSDEHDHSKDHDHEETAEDKHDDHDHEEHASDHDKHDHGSFDPHVWLDPVNAKAMVHEIEEVLVKADPTNAKTYKANAEALEKKLDVLVEEVAEKLKPVSGKGFVVFHDAYQSFEKRFGLAAVGSITISPEVSPGAQRIRELQNKVKKLNVNCVFSEPQFDPKLTKTVIEGTQAKTGVLDPLGTAIEDGPELYFTLIRNMATSFKTCLTETG